MNVFFVIFYKVSFFSCPCVLIPVFSVYCDRRDCKTMKMRGHLRFFERTYCGKNVPSKVSRHVKMKMHFRGLHHFILFRNEYLRKYRYLSPKPSERMLRHVSLQKRFSRIKINEIDESMPRDF